MNNRILISVLIFLPLISIAYQQEYVAADSTAQSQLSASQQNNANNAPINIFVPPKPNAAPNANNQALSSSITPPPAAPISSNTTPTAPATNAESLPTHSQTLQSPPQTQTLPLTSTPQTTAANDYTSDAQATWFKNCLGAVQNGKASAYANAFCQCGWNKISGGGLPANYLTSTNPQETQKANTILRVISQVCLVEVMGTKTG